MIKTPPKKLLAKPKKIHVQKAPSKLSQMEKRQVKVTKKKKAKKVVEIKEDAKKGFEKENLIMFVPETPKYYIINRAKMFSTPMKNKSHEVIQGTPNMFETSPFGTHGRRTTPRKRGLDFSTPRKGLVDFSTPKKDLGYDKQTPTKKVRLGREMKSGMK